MMGCQLGRATSTIEYVPGVTVADVRSATATGLGSWPAFGQRHKVAQVSVAGQKGDASFSFEVADARLPSVAGAVTAHNMIAVLVASFGHQARVVTNAGPWKLAVNGQKVFRIEPLK